LAGSIDLWTPPKDQKRPFWNVITSRIKKGDIILLHDSSEKTVEVLEQVIAIFYSRTNAIGF